MKTIQEQIDAIVRVAIRLRLEENPKNVELIETLWDASETLKRLQALKEYLNPED